jgi:putative tryptophan/tyrosine transport system substrate-binding protein
LSGREIRGGHSRISQELNAGYSQHMANPVGRRTVLTGLGGAAAASIWPVAGRAQKPAMPVIGWLSTATAEAQAVRVAAFRRGLAEMGYAEGQNVAFAFRWAEEKRERLPQLAAELVAAGASVIIASDGPGTARPALTATKTIPIIYQTGGDPVKDGLVASMRRVGGNVSAVTRLAKDVVPKRLALLHELAPAAREIGMLFNLAAADPDPPLGEITAAARALGVGLSPLPAGTEQSLAIAIAAFDNKMKGAALLIGNDAFFLGRRKELGELALRHAVPAAFEHPEFAAAGGLLAYGASLMDSYRLVGLQAGRILKGEPAAELSVVEPRKFELIVNLKTAKALNLIVPASILGAADEVIE